MKEWFEGLAVDQVDRERLRSPSLIACLFVAGLFAAGIATCARAQADGPMFVVATPELQGIYRGAVILVVPMGDQHAGFILNRPTPARMGELFPQHEPSKLVKQPVFFGGPEMVDLLFAMVDGDCPHPFGQEFMPGVCVVSDSNAIDRVIETTPNGARYFAGLVGWKPGELDDELKQGMFVTRPADKAKVFLEDTSTLWNELAPAPKRAGVVGT